MCLFFVKQKTAYEMRISDWSSDVCPSDLGISMKSHCRHAAGLLRASAAGLSLSLGLVAMPAMAQNAGAEPDDSTIIVTATRRSEALSDVRSEERRVGKERVSTCRYRLSAYH